MSALVRTLLGGEKGQAALVRNALLFRALSPAWVDDLPPSAVREAAFAAVEPLTTVDVNDVLQNATPFFWLNLQRFLESVQRDEQIEIATGRLLVSAFDAFEAHLPEDIQFTINLSPQDHLTLVKHHVSRRDPGRNVLLSRSNIESCGSLGAIPVPGTNSQLLPLRDRSIFEDAYVDQILPACEPELAQHISDSLALIRMADPETAERIVETIEWFVPIATPDPAIHCSFTSPRLHGVTFLSATADTLRLGEAIVHEHAHTELHVLMAVENLTGDIADDELFYSPWRPDPRPISGLFHGFYVFSDVLTFLTRLADLDPEREPAVRQRMTVIGHRLLMAVAQVPQQRLNPLGVAILKEVESNVRACTPHLGAPPRSVLDHFERWRTEHPELAASAVRPLS